jgi:hypothetical protein
VNLVIANNLEFERSNDAIIHNVPIVLPEWVFRCVKLGERLSTQTFLADPRNIFSAIKLCVDKVISSSLFNYLRLKRLFRNK